MNDTPPAKKETIPFKLRVMVGICLAIATVGLHAWYVFVEMKTNSLVKDFEAERIKRTTALLGSFSSKNDKKLGYAEIQARIMNVDSTLTAEREAILKPWLTPLPGTDPKKEIFPRDFDFDAFDEQETVREDWFGNSEKAARIYINEYCKPQARATFPFEIVLMNSDKVQNRIDFLYWLAILASSNNERKQEAFSYLKKFLLHNRVVNLYIFMAEELEVKNGFTIENQESVLF